MVVGFDYGTCYTKILWRERGAEYANALRVGDPQPGAPDFLTPSLVGMTRAGRLYFGQRAMTEACDRVYRSLKVKLLPPRGTELPDDELGAEDVDVLVTAFLAWALGGVREVLERDLGGSPFSAAVNVAAPMDHYGNPKLLTRYLRILQAAWAAAFGEGRFDCGQGVALGEVRKWAGPRLRAGCPIEGQETRQFQVLPETLAPLVSLSLDPRMAPGMYLLVDVGAGTTEMSITQARERGADQALLCYHDASSVIGIDDFDRAHGQSTEEERLLGRLRKQAVATWNQGYRKDSPNHRVRAKWKQLVVLMAGGGCMRSDIVSMLKRSTPLDRWGHRGETRYHVVGHQPHGIRLGGETTGRESVQMLAVAHGLSVPRQEWPRMFPPGEVEELDATRALDMPTPYWYLDD